MESLLRSDSPNPLRESVISPSSNSFTEPLRRRLPTGTDEVSPERGYYRIHRALNLGAKGSYTFKELTWLARLTYHRGLFYCTSF